MTSCFHEFCSATKTSNYTRAVMHAGGEVYDGIVSSELRATQFAVAATNRSALGSDEAGPAVEMRSDEVG